MVTATTGSYSHRLVYIVDRPTSMRLVTDTGVRRKGIPDPPDQSHLRPITFTLQSTNGSPVNTTTHKLFFWVFMITNVSQRILEIFFLSSCGLVVDMEHQILLYSATSL